MGGIPGRIEKIAWRIFAKTQWESEDDEEIYEEELMIHFFLISIVYEASKAILLFDSFL